MTFKKAQPYLICGLAVLFYLYDYVIQVSPSVMTHQLRHDFSINATGMGLLGSCFFYAYLIMQLVSGYLLDRFGARLLLTFSALTMGLGTVLFSLSPNIYAASGSRFIIGLGASCAFITAVYLVSRWLSAKYFTFNTGIIQLGACIGAIFGAAPIAIFVNRYGWRHTMLVVGLITWVLAIIFWSFIRNKEKKPNADSNTPHVSPYHNFKTVASNRKVWWIAIASMAAWFPVSAIASLWGVPYLMVAYGWSNVTAGYAVIMFWIAVGVGSPLVGIIAAHTNRWAVMTACFILGTIGTVMFIFAGNYNHTLIYAALILIGILSSVEGIIFSILKDTVPAHTFGTASGFTNTIVVIGSTVAQPIIGKLLDLNWQGALTTTGIRQYSLTNYQHAMIIVPVVAAIGLMAVLFKVRAKG